jgi:hypothetical protein
MDITTTPAAAKTEVSNIKTNILILLSSMNPHKIGKRNPRPVINRASNTYQGTNRKSAVAGTGGEYIGWFDDQYQELHGEVSAER